MKQTHCILLILTLHTLCRPDAAIAQSSIPPIETMNDSIGKIRREIYAPSQRVHEETKSLLDLIPASKEPSRPVTPVPSTPQTTRKTDISETLIISIPADADSTGKTVATKTETLPAPTPSPTPATVQAQNAERPTPSADKAAPTSTSAYSRNEFGAPNYEPVFHRFFSRFKSQLPLKLGSEISITSCTVPDSATIRFTLSYAENNTPIRTVSPEIINTIFVYAMGEKAAATYLISYAYFTGRDIKLTCIGAKSRQRQYATIENGFLEEIYHTFKDHADSLYRAPYRYYNNYDILTAKYLSILLFEPPRYQEPRTLPDGSILNETYLTDRNIVTNISYYNHVSNIDPVKIKNELLQDIPNNPDNYKIYILTHRGLYYSFTDIVSGKKFNISIPYDQLASLSSSMSGLR